MEKILNFVKNAFQQSDGKLKLGAAGGTLAATLLGGLAGMAFGGAGFAILGVLAGLIGGTALSGPMGKLLGKIGAAGPLPGLEGEAQPEPDIAVRRGFTILQPGKDKPVETFVDTPNLERFQRISSSTEGLVSDLVKKRHQIEKMPEGKARHGAIALLLEREGEASQLLANTQEWDRLSAEWTRTGGERDKLAAALKKSRESLGQPFDEKMVPSPPMIKPKVAELSDELREYALNTFVGNGEGADMEAWNKAYPRSQDKLNYLWKKLDDDIKAHQPNWWKARGKFLGFGWRTSTGTGPVKWAFGPQSQTDCANVAEDFVSRKADSFEKRLENLDYALMCVEKGEKYAEGGHLAGGTDEEAINEFRKAQRYIRALRTKTEVDALREKTYGEIRRIETETAKKFPEFIARVQTLEGEIKETNRQMQLRQESKDTMAQFADAGKNPGFTVEEADRGDNQKPPQLPANLTAGKDQGKTTKDKTSGLGG